MTRGLDPKLFWCVHCGRCWDTDGFDVTTRQPGPRAPHYGASTGFVAAVSLFHETACRKRSPAERRAANARDERRWAKRGLTGCRITNDPDHPGLRD